MAVLIRFCVIGTRTAHTVCLGVFPKVIYAIGGGTDAQGIRGARTSPPQLLTEQSRRVSLRVIT